MQHKIYGVYKKYNDSEHLYLVTYIEYFNCIQYAHGLYFNKKGYLKETFCIPTNLLIEEIDYIYNPSNNKNKKLILNL